MKRTKGILGFVMVACLLGGLAGCGGQAASASSGIGSSADSLAEQAGGGAWLEGWRFDSGVPDSELQAWIDGLA